MEIRFLGTTASAPTPERALPAAVVLAGGKRFLWDCGEGTTRRLMEEGWGLNFDGVLLSHHHADHILGIPGLSLYLQYNDDVRIPIVANPLTRKVLTRYTSLIRQAAQDKMRFVESGEFNVQAGDWTMRTIELTHKPNVTSTAFLFERAAFRRFDVEAAERLGVFGPDRARLVNGEEVEVNGRLVSPNDVSIVEPAYVNVLSTDINLRGAHELAQHIKEKNIDVRCLVTEATYDGTNIDVATASRRGHLTAEMAVRLAHDISAEKLVLTHIAGGQFNVEREARQTTRGMNLDITVAKDGLVVKL